MRTFNFPLRDFIIKGIARNDNKRNNPLLVASTGAIPYNSVVKAIEQFTRSTGTDAVSPSFPYPQIFVLSEYIVVCTNNTIYELAGGSLTQKITGLSVDGTWSLVDFRTYLYMVNGSVGVIKDVEGTYSAVTPSETTPYGTCVCNYNGQILLGNAKTS